MAENNNTPQEIDLIELFGNIWNWISNVFMHIVYFFLRNIALFILTGVLSIILGFVAYKSSKPFYNSELLAYSHTISNIEVIKAVNNWNYEKEFTEDELKTIKNISAKYLLDLNDDGIWDVVEEGNIEEVKDTALMNKRIYRAFCIRAELYDTSHVSTIRTKVFTYLENNKRVKDINEIRIKQKKAMLPTLEKEINDLDSLKNLQYFENRNNKANTGDLMILNEKELKLFHNEIISLYNKQQTIERDLFLSSDPFEVVQDFTLPRFQENLLINTLVKFVKYGLMLGFLLILIWDIRKPIIKLKEESKKDNKVLET